MHISNAIFLIGLIAFFVIRGVFKQRTKSNEIVVHHFDAVEKALLILMAPGVPLLPLIYLFSSWLAFADYRLPAFAPYAGTALMIASLWLFWRSHADLGRNWSVTLAVRKDHQLITNGVYRFILHPMYASIWLWVLAQGLLLENWLAGWSALPAFALMYFIRTPREEQLMCETFGQEYRDYMQRTGRIFPRLFKKSEA